MSLGLGWATFCGTRHPGGLVSRSPMDSYLSQLIPTMTIGANVDTLKQFTHWLRADRRWWRMWFPYPRIKPWDGVSEEVLDQRAKDAENHNPPSERYLVSLPHTESDRDWQLLYFHCIEGQIRPEHMWRMRRIDLGYLAGHAREPAQLLTPLAAAKLMANAARAQYELERRDRIWSTGVAAFMGGLVVALVGLL